ncbi:MAG: ABC transporter ATP-binding protein [Desulfobacteraceae bacterium]|jgi:branched-chain amino acid transport system ATP-binding protein
MEGQVLQLKRIGVRYSGIPVIRGISLDVRQGEATCVVGANGAGKSTILKAIMGALRVFDGQILFNNREIQNLKTEEIVRMGITYVPEERMLFSPLSVEENLLLGAYVLKGETQIQRNLDYVYSLFPTLHERQEQAASTLSGGEQQMVAIGRGLMSNPQLLMLDEPSLGLAPRLVDEVLGTVRQLKQEGITILLVEQNVRESLDMADRGYVIQTGRVVLEGSGEELLRSDLVRKAFLGL